MSLWWIVFFWVSFILIEAVAVIWGFKDGEARGKPGILVAILLLLSLPLGLVIWLLFRPPLRRSFADPNQVDIDALQGLSTLPKASDYLKNLGDNSTRSEPDE